MIAKHNILIKYGLNEFFLEQVENANLMQLAKLIAIHKTYYQVINYQGKVVKAKMQAKLLYHQASDNFNLPQIGDFVILQINSQLEDVFFIQAILKRKNVFKRKMIGKKQDMQILAVNIDYILIVMSLDYQFNLKRLERFIIAAFDSAITVIIILTKSDVNPNYLKLVNLVKTHFPDITLLVTTIKQLETFKLIKKYLTPNKIGVLVGVSGSGKSTITNILLGQDTQKIGEVSQERNKGKHTTTHREIFLLQDGGCIIDSPGIKEFGLYLENDYNLNQAFADIILTARQCKFRNCSHRHEPDCAVLLKIKSGEISQERFNHYLQLLGEEQDKLNKHYKK